VPQPGPRWASFTEKDAVAATAGKALHSGGTFTVVSLVSNPAIGGAGAGSSVSDSRGRT
jgi:hypothetical protein